MAEEKRSGQEEVSLGIAFVQFYAHKIKYFGSIIPTSARTDSCIFAAGGKGDRGAPLMRRLADE